MALVPGNVAGEVALNRCTILRVGVWEEKLALVPATPRGPALSHHPLWLFQGVFWFLFPLPCLREASASTPAPAVVRAEAGVRSPRGGTEHPAPLLAMTMGTARWGQRQRPLKPGRPFPAFLLPLGLIISSQGSQ